MRLNTPNQLWIFKTALTVISQQKKNANKSLVRYDILSFKAFFSFHSNVCIYHSLAESCGLGVAHGSFGWSHEPLWTANLRSVFILVSPLPSNCAFSLSFFVKRPSPGITGDDDVASRCLPLDVAWQLILLTQRDKVKYVSGWRFSDNHALLPHLYHNWVMEIPAVSKTLQVRCRRASFSSTHRNWTSTSLSHLSFFGIIFFSRGQVRFS